MNIIIGIDPHKATHTAVAIGLSDETEHWAPSRSGPRSSRPNRLVRVGQAVQETHLAHPVRGGLGYLLAQQLVDAG